MQLTLSGYSTALFSSWYFVEELGLLFDCGDGVTSILLQKSRKIDHVFISHADRDHLTGLLQFNQLNARKDFPVIYYPKDCGSFPALEEFSKKFDPHVSGTVWKKIVDREKIWIRKDIYVQAIKNNHVACGPDMNKSLGYKVVQVKAKLKKEFLELGASEIKKLKDEKSAAELFEVIETILLSYSGDTPCENFEHWNGSQILIHEATFLGGEEDKNIQTHGNKHSQLEEVIRSVSQIRVGTLVLGHFSSRYSDEQIDQAILDCCQRHTLKIPVFRVLPGNAVKHILTGPKVF